MKELEYCLLALELMEYNITVNLYAPGLIATRMIATDADKNFGGEPGSAYKFVGFLSYI